ncbi:MAG: hypothetical protein DSM106950_37320 [Stigonema ocellatum SAG 48.90 = DSM 106950]|nr:hypothetical protein [Stigonema ocellatum SAG 48.90 = DSM 106950]
MDYPVPDPAWDYAQIWQKLQESKSQLDQLLAYMATIEDADPSSDEAIKKHLDEIGQKMNSARRLIDS